MDTVFKFIIGSLLLLTACQELPKNQYTIRTELGNILIEVYEDKAPITVGNFKQYVNQGKFEGAFFYRTVRLDNQPTDSVKIEVVQGDYTGSKNQMAPIAHESNEVTGLNHKNGTISMARSDPGTASSSFFICINDQPELDFGGMRNPDGQGFAAFGKVIDGMDVVIKIQQGKADHQTLLSPIKILEIYKE